MAADLSPGAWVLLGMLRRAKEGGPAAPDGFILEYGELQAKALVVRIGSRMLITVKGETTLHQRYRKE